MKLVLSTFLLYFALFACSSKDEKMCTCLSEGDKLNQFSSTLLTKEITESDVNKLKSLKIKKEKACKAYEMMSGSELLKLKEACK